MARAKLNLRSSTPASEPAPEPIRKKPEEHTGGKGGSREGTKLIGGHFSRATWAKFRQLGIDQDKTSQALLAEALEDLFAKYRA